jgi:plasmid stabilization system protein ParE
VQVKWTWKAREDLARLHAFLEKSSPQAAARAAQALAAAPARLLDHPRIGERLDEFSPREVRRVFVGLYELRYELRSHMIAVLRIWHAREDR